MIKINKRLLLFALFFVSLTVTLFANTNQRITDIRFWQSPEEAQVVLDLSEPPKVSDVGRLNNGSLFFDIKSCVFKPGHQRYALQNQFLESLSVQQNDETGSTRVFFKVPRTVEAKTFVSEAIS